MYGFKLVMSGVWRVGWGTEQYFSFMAHVIINDNYNNNQYDIYIYIYIYIYMCVCVCVREK